VYSSKFNFVVACVVGCCFQGLSDHTHMAGISVVRGEDWPQWMGSRRDNVWRETGLLKRFPADGPSVVWRTPIAGGYAGPAVAGTHVFVTDYVTKDQIDGDNFDRKVLTGIERVWCLDRKSGQAVWTHSYPVKYDISYPAGPRCTPLVDGTRVYTLGAEGHLFCFEKDSGQVLWQVHLPTKYETKTPLWGYAGHPMIDGDRLICIAGGEGSHVVALNKFDGQEVWRALTASQQGYVPPLIIEAAGERQLILMHPDAMESISPTDGSHFWRVPYKADYGSIIMTPVRLGDLIYAGGFNNRNLMVQINKDSRGAKAVWQDQQRSALSAVNVQPFLQDGVMYGFDQSGFMHAVDFTTGNRLWESTAPIDGGRPGKSATAFIIKQVPPDNVDRDQERFWMFNERGELLIARLTPEGFQEIDRTAVIKPTNAAYGRDVVWSAPAWSSGHVFIRNDKECICVDLRANQSD
jgi:outer membrane protein assembly factor BamB